MKGLVLAPKVLVFAFAARRQPLGQEDQKRLRELDVEIRKHDGKYDSIMPALVMARWTAGGRTAASLLDKALGLFGGDAVGCGERVLHWEIITFGDVMLSPDDVPVLLSRARDEHSREHVRIGALRLLGWLGSADERVHIAYLDLLKSERQSIRLAAAEGLALLIEAQNTQGSLLSAAKARLSVEKSQPVVHALTSSVQRITACP